MSGGADEELWGDDDDDAMLAIIDKQDLLSTEVKSAQIREKELVKRVGRQLNVGSVH